MFEAPITNTNILNVPGELRCRTPGRIFPRALSEAFSPKPDGSGHLNSMRFPIVIHKDLDSDYGVTVPDFPGCFSAGDTTDDALSNAVEAIEGHIEGLLLDGGKIPVPNTVEHYRADEQFSDGVWALVDVDVSKLSGKAKRVNITLPERLLVQIDSFAARHGSTRSGLLAHAALEYVAAHDDR